VPHSKASLRLVCELHTVHDVQTHLESCKPLVEWSVLKHSGGSHALPPDNLLGPSSCAVINGRHWLYVKQSNCTNMYVCYTHHTNNTTGQPETHAACVGPTQYRAVVPTDSHLAGRQPLEGRMHACSRSAPTSDSVSKQLRMRQL
jgi:hypothetical protein